MEETLTVTLKQINAHHLATYAEEGSEGTRLYCDGKPATDQDILNATEEILGYPVGRLRVRKAKAGTKAKGRPKGSKNAPKPEAGANGQTVESAAPPA